MESVIERCKKQTEKFKKIYDFESAYWWAEKWLSAVIFGDEERKTGVKNNNYFQSKWIHLTSKQST